MKIAVPIEENGHETIVSISFGRASSFLIFDQETNTSQLLKNTAALSAGGAGIKAAQVIADSGAKILLTPQCGGNAARVLLAAGMRLYKTEPGKRAMDSIKQFLQGELEELTEIHEGFHGH